MHDYLDRTRRTLRALATGGTHWLQRVWATHLILLREHAGYGAVIAALAAVLAGQDRAADVLAYLAAALLARLAATRAETEHC